MAGDSVREEAIAFLWTQTSHTREQVPPLSHASSPSQQQQFAALRPSVSQAVLAAVGYRNFQPKCELFGLSLLLDIAPSSTLSSNPMIISSRNPPSTTQPSLLSWIGKYLASCELDAQRDACNNAFFQRKTEQAAHIAATQAKLREEQEARDRKQCTFQPVVSEYATKMRAPMKAEQYHVRGLAWQQNKTKRQIAKKEKAEAEALEEEQLASQPWQMSKASRSIVQRQRSRERSYDTSDSQGASNQQQLQDRPHWARALESERRTAKSNSLLEQTVTLSRLGHHSPTISTFSREMTATLPPFDVRLEEDLARRQEQRRVIEDDKKSMDSVLDAQVRASTLILRSPEVIRATVQRLSSPQQSGRRRRMQEDPHCTFSPSVNDEANQSAFRHVTPRYHHTTTSPLRRSGSSDKRGGTPNRERSEALPRGKEGGSSPAAVSHHSPRTRSSFLARNDAWIERRALHRQHLLHSQEEAEQLEAPFSPALSPGTRRLMVNPSRAVYSLDPEDGGDSALSADHQRVQCVWGTNRPVNAVPGKILRSSGINRISIRAAVGGGGGGGAQVRQNLAYSFGFVEKSCDAETRELLQQSASVRRRHSSRNSHRQSPLSPSYDDQQQLPHHHQTPPPPPVQEERPLVEDDLLAHHHHRAQSDAAHEEDREIRVPSRLPRPSSSSMAEGSGSSAAAATAAVTPWRADHAMVDELYVWWTHLLQHPLPSVDSYYGATSTAATAPGSFTVGVALAIRAVEQLVQALWQDNDGDMSGPSSTGRRLPNFIVETIATEFGSRVSFVDFVCFVEKVMQRHQQLSERF